MTRSVQSHSVWLIASTVLAGILACAATLFATTEIKYLMILLLGAALALFFVISGNFRATCLYAILLVAPLRLGMPFHVIPHMGGAAAFWLDGIDPLILILLWYQFNDIRRGQRQRFHFSPSLLYWVGMIALGVLSILIAPYRMNAFQEVVRMLKLLLLACVLLNELSRKRQFELAFVTIMVGVLVNSLLALLEWWLGRGLGLEFLGEGSREGFEAVGSVTLISREFVLRPGGLMGAGNLYAAYLAMLVPMAVALFLAPVRRAIRILSGITFVISLPPLVLTLSRSGWMAFAVSFTAVIILGMWHPMSRRRFVAARVGIITGVVIAVAAMSPLILTRLYGSDPNAVDVRLEWLEIARDMALDNPVLGIGLNNYVFAQMDYGKERSPDAMNARYGSYWPAVHSTWALTWAEQGTLGFALFLGMHLSLIGLGIANLRIRDPMMHALGVGLLAGILAIMVDGLASFFVRMDQHARVFWIVVAMLLALDAWRRHNEKDTLPPPTRHPDQPGSSRWLPVVAPSLHATEPRSPWSQPARKCHPQ